MDILGSASRGGVIFDPESGEFINEKFQRIAEIINDYNPELFLMWIPPKDRTAANTKPYAIAHHKADGSWYPVMVFGEEELDHRIIGRLWAMERNTRNLDEYLEEQEKAARAVQYREWADEMEQAHDMAKSIFRSPLHTYHLTKDKVIKS